MPLTGRQDNKKDMHWIPHASIINKVKFPILDVRFPDNITKVSKDIEEILLSAKKEESFSVLFQQDETPQIITTANNTIKNANKFIQ